MNNSPSKTIFVGNIPFNYDPDTLYDTLQMVGKIDTFRVKEENNENEKIKGYGFCEFKDTETALSALKNLKNIDYSGRQLRINPADNDKTGLNLSQFTEENIRSYKDFAHIRDNNSEQDIISTLKSLTEEQKLILLNYMKNLSQLKAQDFKNLLMHQSDDILEKILEMQNEMMANN